jgi:hypothetical protein
MDMDYPTWRTWNIAANDQYPPLPTDVPSRRDEGNRAAGWSYLSLRFNSPGLSPLIAYALQGASDFMNLCEDLKNLATLTEKSATSWVILRSDLTNIIQQDVPSDFLMPTAYALTALMGQSGVQPAFSGPAPNATHEPSINVTVVYS